jgi:tetratricopeptide (TPR) repeat protein
MRTALAAVVFATLLPLAALALSPQLTIKEGDASRTLSLARADVHVQVTGYIAQTAMTLTFANDTDRVLEGELTFPLPENAVVSGYSIDVNGQMVEAVTVSKEKARVTFETEVRKGVDPGIVEHVKGNNFRTRIYPIPAKGTRTIRVQYVSDLVGDSAGNLAYSLPMNWSKPVPEGSLKIEVIKSQNPPAVKSASVDGVTFAKWEDRFVSETKLAGATLNKDLVIALPAVPPQQAIVEKRTVYPRSVENLANPDAFSKVEHYFVINDLPAIPQVLDQLTKKPDRVLVVYDASLSRAEVDKTRELSILQKHLASLNGVPVDLLVFRNTAEAPEPWHGSIDKLIDHLKSLPHDGGTALGAVRVLRNFGDYFPNLKGNRPPDYAHALLLTDGLSNLGNDLPPTPEIPVYAISNDARANHAALRHVAATSGGAYLNLARLTDAQALASIGQQPFALLSVDTDGAEIADLYPRPPAPVQGRVTLCGKLLARSAKLTLNYGRGKDVQHRVSYTLTTDGATETGLIPRFWAQQKVADLSLFAEKNDEALTKLGKEFNLVTPNTSMIVLERVEQYVQHGIVPPKSQPALYAEFMKQIEAGHQTAKADTEAKISRVLGMWNARVAWWNQAFTYPANPRVATASEKKAEALGDEAPRVNAPRPAPAEIANAAVDAIRGERERVNGPASNGENRPRPSTPAERAENLQKLAQETLDPTTWRDAGGSVGGGQGGGGGARDRRTGGSGGGLFGSAGGRADDLKDGAMRDQLAGGQPAGPTIAIKQWSPDTPYLKALQSTKGDDRYAQYLAQRKAYLNSPAFYHDCADFFHRAGQTDLAVRLLTNIPELKLEDGRLLRIAAHRLQQLNELDLAIDLFDKVSRLRPEEPQSFRDLALALAARADGYAAVGHADRARSDYARALELLHKVVMSEWQRFEEIEVISLMEANQLLASIATRKLQVANPLDPRLTKLLDLDLRILLTWDTDNTDIDLHVVEPSGEECDYSHNRTRIGGLVSKDFTQGYGPEEYALKKLMPGQYTIRAQFYGSGDQSLVGPTTVQATVITGFGRPDEKRQHLTLRLTTAKETVDIGTVTLK